MISTKSLINALQSGTYDNALSRLYALDGRQTSLERARERAIRVAEQLTSCLVPGSVPPPLMKH